MSLHRGCRRLLSPWLVSLRLASDEDGVLEELTLTLEVDRELTSVMADENVAQRTDPVPTCGSAGREETDG